MLVKAAYADKDMALLVYPGGALVRLPRAASPITMMIVSKAHGCGGWPKPRILRAFWHGDQGPNMLAQGLDVYSLHSC